MHSVKWNKNLQQNTKAYLAWVSICIVWGTTYLAIRIGVQDLPPLLFAGFRWIIAGSIFITFLRWRKYKFPKLSEIKHLAVVGILLLGFGNGLVVFGEQWVPSGLASLLITTLPFWVVGIESFLPSSIKPNKWIIAGIILGFLGASLIVTHDLETLLETSYWLGIVSLLMGVMAWASGTVYAKYMTVEVKPQMAAGVQMLIAGILQTIIGISIGELPQFHFQSDSFLALLYLIFVGSFLGYTSYIYAIKHLPVSFVSTYTYINPVIALFLGWLILDESLNLRIMVAALIILAGVSIVRYGVRKNRLKAE